MAHQELKAAGITVEKPKIGAPTILTVGDIAASMRPYSSDPAGDRDQNHSLGEKWRLKADRPRARRPRQA